MAETMTNRNDFIKVTEQASLYHHLEKMSVVDLLTHINEEDHTVPDAVAKAIPQIEALVQAIADQMLMGGRLFYIGAGTSGRLAVVDASECPPTYGVPQGLVVAVSAGGEKAITMAIGTTPYVIGALEQCRKRDIVTGSVSCNPNSPISSAAEYPIEVVVGPEFVTGSTRMKSGTAQKLVLNMISTTVMIQLGRVEDNKMVNMQLTNEKLVDRGTKMVMERTGMNDYDKAKDILLKFGSVKKAVENLSRIIE